MVNNTCKPSNNICAQTQKSVMFLYNYIRTSPFLPHIHLSLSSFSILITYFFLLHKDLDRTEEDQKASRPCLFNTVLLTLFKITTFSVLKQQYLLISLRSQVSDFSICIVRHKQTFFLLSVKRNSLVGFKNDSFFGCVFR